MRRRGRGAVRTEEGRIVFAVPELAVHGLVVIEEVQLEEIFINIIRNAIQAMEPRGQGNVWLSSRAAVAAE